MRDHEALAAFERIYRVNVGAITRYFARRCVEPQLVADLTADTFVRAITSFPTFDPSRGTATGWLYGIARKTFSAHCEQSARGTELVRRVGGRRELGRDELAELEERIDAERPGRLLLERLETLPEIEREAVELVHLGGLAPKEAAEALGVPRGAMRSRLYRAMARMREVVRDEMEVRADGQV
ncbi:RNA polymerase sigma factor [Lentzea flava]|uniref:DNA-directed RNA polymerase sigma-70 factor n=1 Tax=Lentzea flava TaxID=103732 RepID=A0ABQ2UVS7_9PSEU|nr:RNA polymerase sigma factor [Lentzea flava]MCP2201946.1 RNA polymerase sigma-70 factor, ECF subfamily [Lentzea flava]GGU56440.1 DNA-directed RNA polymerase sigma-70 factor [Lentzea flava]